MKAIAPDFKITIPDAEYSRLCEEVEEYNYDSEDFYESEDGKRAIKFNDAFAFTPSFHHEFDDIEAPSQHTEYQDWEFHEDPFHEDGNASICWGGVYFYFKVSESFLSDYESKIDDLIRKSPYADVQDPRNREPWLSVKESEFDHAERIRAENELTWNDVVRNYQQHLVFDTFE